MDDGSIKSKYSKGCLLNTHCFTFKEVQFLCSILNDKFALQSQPRYQKDGYQIYISGHSYELLHSLIYPYLLESMRYKFPTERKVLINNRFKSTLICLKSNGEAQR